MTKKLLSAIALVLLLSLSGFTVYAGLLRDSRVMAEAKEDAVMYRTMDVTSGRICFIPKGEKVEILQDRSTKWYQVDYCGTKGWLLAEALIIPPDEPVVLDMPFNPEWEDYVNSNGFSSTTNRFVLVDIARQKVIVFKGAESEFTVEKVIVCSTGKNESPTKRGSFKLTDKGEWFYSERLGSGAMYWVRYSNNYLFHSLAMDEGKNILDFTLGEKRSSGCVRMSVEDAKWFYENLPYGTTVFIP